MDMGRADGRWVCPIPCLLTRRGLLTSSGGCLLTRAMVLSPYHLWVIVFYL